MRIKRKIIIEEIYDLPGVTSPVTAADMLKSAEKRDKPYTPIHSQIIQKGHWKVLKY